MWDVLPVIISGIASGSAYALLSLGIVIIFRSTDTVNFAIGDIGTIGVYVAATAISFHVPHPIALFLAIAVSGCVGIASERIIVRPLLDRPNAVFIALVITIGLGLFIRALIGSVWGHELTRFPPMVSGTVDIFGLALAWNKVLPTVLAVVTMALVAWFFSRTSFGTAMRASAEDPFAARMIGLNSAAIAMLAWFLGCGLSAIAMFFLAAETALTPELAHQALFRGFAGVFLGGLNSMPGAVVGGLAIGVLDNIAGRYVSANLRDSAVFLVIVLVLFLRPSGMLGTAKLERV